jgi:hypothetical protein
VKGDIAGTEDLLIDGSAKGLLRLDHWKLTVGSDGEDIRLASPSEISGVPTPPRWLLREEDLSVSAAGRALSGTSIETSLRQLLKDAPRFHTAGEGVVDWGIQESFLWRLAALVTPSSLTLETGSGLSTICLAIIGAEHICISPDEREHHRIRRYCADHNISTEQVRFVPLKSQVVLPSLDLRGHTLDFVLIDGSHAFPDPMIDYYFANRHLKVGGLLAIDDLNISSVGVLHKFLLTEPAYELIEINGDWAVPQDWRDADGLFWSEV